VTTTASASTIRGLDLGPERPSGLTAFEDAALGNVASGAVVAGSLVAFAPGVSGQHRQDILESLLLAQFAANARADRYKDPVGWFRAYSGVLEQAAWVVEGSSSVTRYLPQTSSFSAGTVVVDTFRRRLTPEELQCVTAAVNAFMADTGGPSQVVFECPSHSGGIGNFQVALATEENGEVSLRIVEVSFNAPQHVTQLLLEQFTSAARFQVAFLGLTQNEDAYARLRSTISSKVESRFQGAVVLLTFA
jgi:hypothetical protein